MNLHDKKILIFGASGLLGSVLVKKLLSAGAKVIAADLDLMRLEKKFEDLENSGADQSLNLCKIDITKETELKTLFDEVYDLTGTVNCSYPRNSTYGNKFYDVSLESFNENISLNIGSSFAIMKYCALYFKKTKKPFSLVNISSIYGVVSPKFNIYENTSMTMPVEYSAIKSSLIHLSKYVTKYVSDSRFRVNLVSPGGIIDGQPEEFLRAYSKETFGQGMLDSEDVVDSIIFLLSDASKFINGQNIIIDDGFSL